jgi:hypothetical protein
MKQILVAAVIFSAALELVPKHCRTRKEDYPIAAPIQLPALAKTALV